MKKQVAKQNINKVVQDLRPDSFNGLCLMEIKDIKDQSASYIFDECVILLWQQGFGNICINDRHYNLTTNSVILVPPNYLIRDIHFNPEFLAKGIFFSIDLITDLIKNNDNLRMYSIISERSVIVIPPETKTELIEYYDFLEREYKMPEGVFKPLIIKNLLFTVLLKIGEVYFLNESKSFADDRSRGSILTARFFELVSQYHQEQRNMSFYADKMFISRKYLSTIIKERTGRQALTWIHEQIILTAKVMLKTSNMTVSEISYTLNFPTPSFFGRLFRKYSGMTPNEYRRS